MLCPPERRNIENKGITVDIDYLHLDNTFANPEYDFPTREEAYNCLKKIIEHHENYRVFLFSYHLGKEEVFLNLADDFKSLIVVDEERYRKAKIMNLQPEKFTTHAVEGWIHVKSIKELKSYDIQECNKEEPTIFIILTGWNDKYNRNLPYYFKVPYSSHSNYREIEMLVKACMPRNLIFNVDDRAITPSRLEFQQHLIKSYCTRSLSHSDHILNDPKKGLVYRKYESKEAAQKFISQEKQALANPTGFDKNGDTQLTERFNPNNTELNKVRFQRKYGHIIGGTRKKATAIGAKIVVTDALLELSASEEETELKNQQSDVSMAKTESSVAGLTASKEDANNEVKEKNEK